MRRRFPTREPFFRGAAGPTLAAAFILLSFATALWAEKVEQLKPTNYLNDFANVVDGDSAAKINALAGELERRTNAQVTVVTIRSLEGATAQDFGNRLFKQWGVGTKKTDRGVLVLMAVEEHQYWTEVGYGLEPILPDGKVGGFGREMVPLLRQQQYGPALLQMTQRVAAVIAADSNVTLETPVPAERPVEQPDQQPSALSWLPLVLKLIFFLFVLRAIFGRRGGSSWMLLPFLMGGGGGRRGGGWGGGGFGGGGGGGGFSGFGGGSSGGGGAGGSW